jgi:hypothetical protein
MRFGNFGAPATFTPVLGEGPALTELRRRLFDVEVQLSGWATQEQIPGFQRQRDELLAAITRQIAADAKEASDAFNNTAPATDFTLMPLTKKTNFAVPFVIGAPKTNGNTPSTGSGTDFTLMPLGTGSSASDDVATAAWKEKQAAIKRAQEQADADAANARTKRELELAEKEKERLRLIAEAHANDPAASSGFGPMLAGAGAGFLVGGPLGAVVGGALAAFLKK